jgi:hypothetical protein
MAIGHQPMLMTGTFLLKLPSQEIKNAEFFA